MRVHEIREMSVMACWNLLVGGSSSWFSFPCRWGKARAAKDPQQPRIGQIYTSDWGFSIPVRMAERARVIQ
jgi:hypothetical protein